MATSVPMPHLGESVTEGTVTRWLKAEGDHVDAEEPLLEVSTDKVDTEVPSPVSGTLLSIKVKEDETVEVGTELAVVGEAGHTGQPGQADQAARSGAATDGPPASAQAGTPSEPAPAASPERPSARGSQPVPAVADSEPRPAARTSAGPTAPAAAAPSLTPVAPVESSGDLDQAGQVYVTPLVRKLAAQHDVDLSKVEGTGVSGRVRKSDVIAAANRVTADRPVLPEQPQAVQTRQNGGPGSAAATTALPPVRGQGAVVEPMSRTRRVIAARMVESLQTAAQLTTVVEVDVTRIARLREEAKTDFAARNGVKLSFLPFFAVAVIEALKAHPVVNASVDMGQQEITYHGAEHLGIAVDTDRGLLVPVIPDAGDLNLAALARKIADVAQRARANNVSPDELGGGTFTLTNTGSRGALFDTPIINQPQAAILGTGAVVKRAVVVSGALGETFAIRSMVYLALSYDHRIIDGADAARFLVTMKDRLEAGDFGRSLGLT